MPLQIMSFFKLQTTLLSLLFLIINIQSQTNQYIEETGPNGEDIWRSTSDFIPVQSQSFGTITIGRTMSMSFDFVWWGRTNDPSMNKYEMFFRVGFNGSYGNGCDGQGARYPSFWIKNNADTMHLSVSDGTSCQPPHSLGEYGSITIGTSYHVNIEFNDTLLIAEITGPKPKWSKQWSRTPVREEYIGQTVPVWWMSNKYCSTDACVNYNRGNGTFSNVTIISYGFATNSTSEPTAVSTTDATASTTENSSFSLTTTAAVTSAATIESTATATTTTNPITTSEATTNLTTAEPTSGVTTEISTTYPITTSVPTTSAINTAIESTINTVTESTANTATESTINTATESTINAATESTANTATESTANTATESTINTATESTTNATANTTSEPTATESTNSTSEPTAVSTTDATANTATESTINAATESTTNTAIQSTTNTVTESTTNTASESTANTAIESTINTATESTANTATESTTNTVTESTANTATASTTNTSSAVHTTNSVIGPITNTSVDSILIVKKTNKITFNLPFDIFWFLAILILPLICIVCGCFAVCLGIMKHKTNNHETEQSKDAVIVSIDKERPETDESIDVNEFDEEMKAEEIPKERRRKGTVTRTHTIGNHTMMDTIEIVNHPSKLIEYEESEDSNMYYTNSDTRSTDSMHHRSGAIHRKPSIQFKTMIMNEDIREITDGTEDSYTYHTND